MQPQVDGLGDVVYFTTGGAITSSFTHIPIQNKLMFLSIADYHLVLLSASLMQDIYDIVLNIQHYAYVNRAKPAFENAASPVRCHHSLLSLC